MIRKSSFIFSGIIILIVLCSFLLKEYEINNDVKTKEDLGKKLFFDSILSSDKTISCASCHRPELAFADSVPLSKGVDGKLAVRNTPSAMNMANRNAFFYDGRAESLEEQALGPIQHPNEMNLPIKEAIKRLNESQEYVRLFKKIWKEKPNEKNLTSSIAAFENTLETTSRFDEYANGKKDLFTEQEVNGHQLFIGKAKCFDCHFGIDFTVDEFRNIGLYNEKEWNDKGRFDITKKESDKGKFKVPGLRNVAVTAPYMHNGKFKTLEEVVEYYNEPDKFIQESINRDTSLNKPLGLNEQEKKDLVAFLKTLTDNRFLQK